MAKQLPHASSRVLLARGADGLVTADAVRNRFWLLLPGAVRERLIRHAKRIRLTLGQAIFQAHEPVRAVYFPETALISRIARLLDGQTLEVGLIGNDGMAGISIVPGTVMAYDGIVHIAGTAVRIDAAAMAEELRHPGATHELLCKYAWAILGEGMQIAACNNFHDVGTRCARWLLMMDDAIERHDFKLTQDRLAEMLGVRRATVTPAAQALLRRGIIEYKHGRLSIRNRAALEAAACECYRTMRDTRRNLLGY